MQIIWKFIHPESVNDVNTKEHSAEVLLQYILAVSSYKHGGMETQPQLLEWVKSSLLWLASDCVRRYEPFKSMSSDSGPFVMPNFPGEIKMTGAQVPYFLEESIDNDLTQLMKRARESEVRSYGIVVNSFYELEPVYADYYTRVWGRKAWHTGPLSPCNRDNEEKS
ncbi:unnamed protein product [Prunus brigantina]